MMTQSQPVPEGVPRSSTLVEIPINKTLVTCHDEGINKCSDTDTPEVDPGLPSPRHFQRRHSLLSPQQSPMKDPVEFITIGPQTTSKDPSSIQTIRPKDFDRWRQQDDAEITPNGREWEPAAERTKESRIGSGAAEQPDEEKHIVKG